MKWFSVFVLVLGFAIFVIPSNTAHGLAGVGTEQLCIVTTGSTFTRSNDSNDLHSQGFRPASTFNLGAVKVNLRRIAIDAVLNVHVVEGVGAGENHQPDMLNILGTETISTATLPEFDLITGANNTFNCDPDIVSSQVVIFDPVIPLSANDPYHIVVEYASGATSSTIWAWHFNNPAENVYPDGADWDCNVPTSCSRNSFSTWDLNSGGDFSLALFDTILVFENPTDSAEAWLERVLNEYGLNDVNGKLLVTVLVGIGITMGLVVVRTHPILILGVLSMWAGTAVTATLIPAWITLTMAAIFAMMLLYGLILGRGGSAE